MNAYPIMYNNNYNIYEDDNMLMPYIPVLPIIHNVYEIVNQVPHVIEDDEDEILGDIGYDEPGDVPVDIPVVIGAAQNVIPDNIPGDIPDEIPDLIIINDENDNLPVVNENNIILTLDDLLDQLDNFINRRVMCDYIMTHIDYILYALRENDQVYNNDQINHILNAYNLANQYPFSNIENQLIERFKDIINQSNNDQNKFIFNTMSELEY